MSSMIEESEVRARISAQLDLVRDLCHALVTVARAAGLDDSQRPAICDVLGEVYAVVDRHFQYEEEVVAPLLREVDAWGPVRVERLFQEHAAQRSSLRALAEDARDGMRSVEELADEVIGFFRSFEQQIVEAERRLLDAEAAGADPSVDQIDG